MILGTIDPDTGRPYVQGRLLLPRLRIDGRVDFLVDTGADCTVLHPGDVLLLQVDYAQLKGDVPIQGAGGIVRNCAERGLLVFAEENRRLLRAYSVDLMIPPPSLDNLRLPSLLGRDVLDRWEMRFSRSRGLLRFTVVSADSTIQARR